MDLQKHQNRDWEDPYEKSKKLRNAFRVERKSLERAEANREALKDKMSLGIDVADETEDDRLRASMVDFGHPGGGGAAGGDSITSDVAKSVRLRPMFSDSRRPPSSSPVKPGSSSKLKKQVRKKNVKPVDLIAERKIALRNELRSNTRAAVDPFLNDSDELAWQPEIRKRKLNTSNGNAGQNKLVPERRNNNDITRHVDGNGKRLVGLPGAKDASLSAAPIEETQPPAKRSTPVALVDYTSDSE